MKVAYCSDLHLEFCGIFLENTENADCLILAGDIVLSRIFYKRTGHSELYERFINFFDDVSKKFKYIIVIAGNHEFYHFRWFETINVLSDFYSKYDNVYFLNNDTITLDGINFIGATLWTDLGKRDVMVDLLLPGVLNDYTLINNERNRYKYIKPKDTYIRHRTSLDYIVYELNKFKGMKNVVVTHHAPSMKSINPKFQDDYVMNCGYASSLEEVLMEFDILVWFHGHIHSINEYDMFDVKVLSNPRGYVKDKDIDNSFKLKYIEV